MTIIKSVSTNGEITYRETTWHQDLSWLFSKSLTQTLNPTRKEHFIGNIEFFMTELANYRNMESLTFLDNAIEIAKEQGIDTSEFENEIPEILKKIQKFELMGIIKPTKNIFKPIENILKNPKIHSWWLYLEDPLTQPAIY